MLVLNNVYYTPPPPTFIPILAKVCIIYTRLEGYEFMITVVVK